MIHEIHYYVDDFDMFYPAVSTYIQFHELTLMIGVIILFLTSTKKVEKYILLLLSSTILLNVFFVSVKVISLYSIYHFILTCFIGAILSIYIMQFKSADQQTYDMHQMVALAMIGFYVMMYLYLRLFEKSNLSSHEPTTMKTLLILSYMVYQYGIFQYFMKRYKHEFANLYDEIIKE
jgi:hypothetical protein